MRTHFASALLSLSLALGLAVPARATQVNFSNGTVTMPDNTTGSTSGNQSFYDFASYEENGFRITRQGDSLYIGDYYGVGNNVIHGHWETGGIGSLDKILITRTDNAAFDLNYFVLTSNTDRGGAPASGNERAYIHASIDGVTSSYSQLLPPENWGFPATNVFLGSNFDNIKAFWFTAENPIACFGMDNFFINEDAPVPNPTDVPEPSTFALLGLGLAGFALRRRK